MHRRKGHFLFVSPGNVGSYQLAMEIEAGEAEAADLSNLLSEATAPINFMDVGTNSRAG